MPTRADQDTARLKGEAFRFGPFRFDPRRQLLECDGDPVRVGSRALAILQTLIEAEGALVSKEEILAQVWPGLFVEESNLRVHVAALRRALGDTQTPLYIATVPGRGYRFIAEIDTGSPAAPPEPRARQMPAAVPASLPILGRASEIEAVLALVLERRFVTVTGAGGVGKTSVARNVAARTGGRFRDGVVSVDFSAAKSAALALGDALKISVSVSEPLGGLTSFLAERQMLLLLDSCEHVIDELAALIEAAFRRAPGLHILATSTEPMRTEGEWVYRLQEFEVPPDLNHASATQALVNPAIAFFVERASATSDHFAFHDRDVAPVAEVCRRLDGNPLAIELAAARVDAFGLAELARQIDDRFELLTTGRRTTTPRHRTLRNMLDWSYGHLTATEQALLRRLSVFRGQFGMDGVMAVSDQAQSVLADLMSLVNKSLVVARTGGARSTYRLLDTTRAYAAERAAEAQETRDLCLLHARHLEHRLGAAQDDWLVMDREDWVRDYGALVDDLRAALDWAFSAEGDPALGVRLTSGALPIALQRGLIDELRYWMDRATERAPKLSPRELAAEVRIQTTFGTLAQNQQSVFGSQARGYEAALRLADLAGNKMLRVGALIGYSAFELGLGSYRSALRHAEDAEAIVAAHGDDLARLGVNRVLAQATLFSGQNARAHQLATAVIQHPSRRIPLAYGVIAVDRAVSMRIVSARAHWLMGRPVGAAEIAAEAVALGRRDSPLGYCQALALAAVPVALWSGEDAAARQLTVEMREEAERYTLSHWRSWGDLFLAVLDRRAGTETALAPRGSLQQDTVVTFDASLVDEEIAERAGHQDGWCEPEIARAAIRLMKPDQRLSALRAALERSARTGALGWQLRIATTIAEDLIARDRRAEARAVLEPVFAAFGEGFATRDLLRAAEVLAML
ncbi:hypothetical protein GC209_13390 [bacterium]|nr:hypothetical protein [bacterium]